MVISNQEILQIAMEQSAIDSGCAPEDFLARENKVVLSRQDPRARKYLELPFSCDLTSYGGNIVASVSPELRQAVESYLNRYPAYHCFETPHLYVLNRALKPYGQQVCFMAEYFLPDVEHLQPLPCGFSLRVLEPAEFQSYYLPQWSNALCEKRKHLDVLAVGAFDGERLIGLAGCSADCESMWQIGIDVLPEYRRQGIASALTSRLAVEVLKRGKVPFYCCAWSNVASARNAIRCGFRPAWVQLTAKSMAFVDSMNGEEERREII